MSNRNMHGDSCSQKQGVPWGQSQDLDTFTVLEWCGLGEKPRLVKLSTVRPYLKKLWHAFVQPHNGLLGRRVDDRLQGITPAALVPDILE